MMAHAILIIGEKMLNSTMREKMLNSTMLLENNKPLYVRDYS